MIGKQRFNLRIAQLQEGTVPQKVRRRLSAQLSDLIMIGFSQLAIDFQKCLDQVSLVLNARTMRHHLRYDFLQESVIEGDLATTKLLWEDLVPKARHRLVSGTVARHNLQQAVV